MMTEDDIDKARTLMPALLDRLEREWRTWKRREGSEPLLFDKYLLPDKPGEPLRSKGVRICVKKWGEEPLGYWRFEADKFIFSQEVNRDGHQFAALTENGAVAPGKVRALNSRGRSQEVRDGPIGPLRSAAA